MLSTLLFKGRDRKKEGKVKRKVTGGAQTKIGGGAQYLRRWSMLCMGNKEQEGASKKERLGR